MIEQDNHIAPADGQTHRESGSVVGKSGKRFELTSFLHGKTTAWGIFEDRFGRIQRRFNVEMHGRWQGLVFHLDEKFTYDSGDVETRTWLVVPGANGHFSATCADCIGEASGGCTVDSIRMSYKFRLKLSARSIIVDFDDRIYQMGSRFAVNRATMKKWGVKLGELSLFFQREDVEPPTDAPPAAA